uniref:Uncharacterized protein n=1 Tax=Amphimedon queenslandica TaxID=400682 RepID=A0A1X7VJD3_AMPQE
MAALMTDASIDISKWSIICESSRRNETVFSVALNSMLMIPPSCKYIYALHIPYKKAVISFVV